MVLSPIGALKVQSTRYGTIIIEVIFAQSMLPRGFNWKADANIHIIINHITYLCPRLSGILFYSLKMFCGCTQFYYFLIWKQV